MKRNNTDILFAIFLVLIAVSARILNQKLQLHNIAPLAAIGLFSGAIIKDRRSLAFLVPVLGQFLADVYFQLFTNTPGFYDVTGQLFNYGALIATTALGVSFRQPKPAATIAYLFGASTLFFLVSNFGYFASGWNGYSLTGLVKTYIDGVPFFKFTLLGDMVGGVLLFGSYFLAQNIFVNKAEKARV
jgi:hypothetical protein